jgi:hypothetical protein
MKKNFFIFSALVFLLFISFLPFNIALAVEDGGSMLRDGIDRSANVSGLKPAEGSDISLPVMIGQFLKGGMVLLGLLFLILVIYAGIGWMTAGGEEKKATSAQKTIVSAAIGLVITLLAYQITSYIISNIQVVPTAPEPQPADIGAPPNPAAQP